MFPLKETKELGWQKNNSITTSKTKVSGKVTPGTPKYEFHLTLWFLCKWSPCPYWDIPEASVKDKSECSDTVPNEWHILSLIESLFICQTIMIWVYFNAHFSRNFQYTHQHFISLIFTVTLWAGNRTHVIIPISPAEKLTQRKWVAYWRIPKQVP